jgi:outer membrane protein assembly factor BamA
VKRCLLFLLAGILFPGFLLAQQPDSYVEDSLSMEFRVKHIRFIGNKKTRRDILLREFTFREGDVLSRKNLEDQSELTRQNLNNTALFNFVSIHRVERENNEVEIWVQVTERWYLWPAPILEIADRNFNIWWKERDYRRLNYGFYLMLNNFRGKREVLQLTVRMGTWQQYRLLYHIPFIDKKQRSGLTFAYSYLRNRELFYRSINNELQNFKDRDNYVRQEQYAKIRYQYRHGIYNTHSIEARYNQGIIADTILSIGPGYFSQNRNNTEFFSLHYFFVSDHRDNRPYPLKGYLFGMELAQSGLGMLSQEDFSLFRMEPEVRVYFPIVDRFYGAFRLKGKVSSLTNQPYYLQRGLGYGMDYIRGYEFFVMDGQHYALFKSNIKYQMIKPRTVDWGFLGERFTKFHYAVYLSGHADAGYVWDRLYANENPLSNTAISGFGMGLDFVTFYDRVLRFEASLNNTGKPGFFVHYGAAF